MTRKSFSLTTLSAVLLGLLMLASTSNLLAQTAPPPPAAPSIGISATPEPPPPYSQSNPGPTSILFTITFTDSTDGATIIYNVTAGGNSSAGQITSTPSTTPKGSVTVSLPVNNTSSGVASAYAYIPADTSVCPPIPQSPNSSTTTAPF